MINGCISSIFLVCTSLCFFLPTNFDENMQQTIEDFNWTCVVYGACLFIAGTYWFLPKGCGGARHFFTGPMRPEDVAAEGEFKEKKLGKDKHATDATSMSMVVADQFAGTTNMTMVNLKD